MRLITLLCFFIFCAGCTVTQNVEPVHLSKSDEICVIENSNIHKASLLLDLYTRALADKGLQVKILKNGSSRRACTLTSVYAARWGWDFGDYMTYLKLRVYQDGKLVGEATFDARDGGGRIVGKGIDDQEKMIELVNQLIKL